MISAWGPAVAPALVATLLLVVPGLVVNIGLGARGFDALGLAPLTSLGVLAFATLMVPLTISIAQAAHVDPRIPALGATLAASFGFMFPISTGPNAMAYGTGQVKVREMAGAGILIDVVGFVIILAGLRLLA